MFSPHCRFFIYVEEIVHLSIIANLLRGRDAKKDQGLLKIAQSPKEFKMNKAYIPFEFFDDIDINGYSKNDFGMDLF